MWLVSRCRRSLSFVVLVAASSLGARTARAQDLPRVSATRKVAVAGVGVEPRSEDLLGLSRVKFQGLIATELASVGYSIASPDETARRPGDRPPLTLTGRLKEEICDDVAPSQCRIAILWELEDRRGVAVYRALTRAVDQKPTIDQLRRALISGAVRSLLQRRRFALQLTDVEPAPSAPTEPLGFKQCRRPALTLPAAARSAAASLVLVESGSNLASGAIVSGDGLILTSARNIVKGAPLRVRFSAQQTQPAEIVAIESAADVALLHVPVNTGATCLPLREEPVALGATLFGVSSELSEDAAVSLSSAPLTKGSAASGKRLLHVEPRIAHASGAALLDEDARLVGIVSTSDANAADGPHALEIGEALQALKIKPAAVTDPRLLTDHSGPTPAVGFVRDRDDPPYALTKRYTYGTSTTARRVRTASAIVTGAAALGVAATWLSFRANPEMSPGAHHRTVVLNDLSWVLLGLGAVGFGATYAWPEEHDVVGGQSASRRELFIGVAGAGLALAGRL
jgi:S1-C subfamily serine protease